MAGEVEGLLRAYERFVSLPWEQNLAGSQKVWFAVYDPAQERRLRFRIPEFEVATEKAGHKWLHLDLTDSFAHWLAEHDYRDAYFEQPDYLELALEDFATHIADRVGAALAQESADTNTVLAVSGVGALFGLARVSVLVEKTGPAIRGRMLVFFPGGHEGSNYRLLDARDGWNYLAIPLTATEGE